MCRFRRAFPPLRRSAVALALLVVAVFADRSALAGQAGNESVPSPPHDVSVVPVSNGFRIQWINPSTREDGSPLLNFGGIQVLRNGFAIATIMREPSAAGRNDTFVDVTPHPGSSWQLRAFDDDNPRQVSALTEPAEAPGAAPAIRLTLSEVNEGLQPGEVSSDLGIGIRNVGTELLMVGISETASWLEVTPASASVAGLTSTTLSFHFDAGNLATGAYTDSVLITSNDPRIPVTTLPVRLSVGVPELEVSPEALAFSVASMSQPHTTPLVLSNPGFIPLEYRIESLPGWLQSGTASGVVPAAGSIAHSFTARATGLSTGSYPDSVIVVSNDPLRPRLSIAATLDFVRSPPAIVMTPSTLHLEYRSGGNLPSTELRISNNGTDRLDYSLLPDVSWLFAGPPQGSIAGEATAVIDVRVVGAELPPGDHSATIAVTSNDPATPATAISVALTILPSLAAIVTDPDTVDVGPVPLDDVAYDQVVVSNRGSTVLILHATENSPWLQIQTSPYLSVAPGSSDSLALRIETDALAAGNYETWLTLTTNDPSRPTVLVPVRMRVVVPRLEAATRIMVFSAAWKGPAENRPLVIWNRGDGVLHLELTSSPPAWLVPTQVGEVAPGTSGTIRVLLNPQDLDVGEYGATLVYATNDPGNPRFDVVIDVVISPTPPALTLDPEGVNFQAVENGPTLLSSVRAANAGYETLEITVSETVPWLLARPQVASLGPEAETFLDLQAAPAGLPVGTYSTTVEIHSNDSQAADRSLPVTLTIRPWNGNTTAQRIAIEEIAFACGSGNSRVQFLTLMPIGVGETHDPDIGLRAEDRFGAVLFDNRDLFDRFVEGTPWPEGEPWLIGTHEFSTVTGISPDGLPAAYLDPLGGTLTLYHGDPGNILHRFSYGVARGAPAPAAGHSLRRDESGVMVENDMPLPRNSHGDEAAPLVCPCPGNILVASGVTVGSSAYSDHHPKTPPGQPITSLAGYNLRTGTFRALGRSARLSVRDVYHATGAAGTPLVFDAVLKVRGSGQGSGMYQGGSMSASIQVDDSNPVTVSRSGSSMFYEGELVVSVRATPPETFRLTFVAAAGGELHGGTGNAEGTLEFRNLPPGVTIRSCQGFEATAAPPPDLEIIGNEGDFGVARVTWSVPGGRRLLTVERREESGDWLPYGIVEVDASDRATFEDTNVAAGVRYGYRLDLLDRFAGAVEITVPVPPAVFLGAAYPNPTRGDLWVPVSLPDNESAILTLYDVAGREIVRQDIGSLGPGTVRVNMTEQRRLAAGVYLVKLTKRGEEQSVKVVVIR